MTDHNQAEYEAALRWRLELLKDKLGSGNIVVADHLAADFEKSIGAVKYQPDGQIDLSTVDALVRSTALIADSSQNRQNSKDAISLSDISSTYFEFIGREFQSFADQARSNGLDAHQFAMAVSRNASSVAEIVKVIPEFLDVIEQFWLEVTDASHYHIQDLSGSKSIYGGDLFPSFEQNIASTVGLYIETIVLSDPFWNSRHIFRSTTDTRKVYYLIKHAINVLSYQDLALASTNNPIIVVTPFKSSVDDHEYEFLRKTTHVDALKHASVLFGRIFEDAEELFKFGEELSTPELVVAALADADRLLFDTEWQGSKQEQISRALTSDWKDLTGDDTPGRMVVGQCFGRMGQSTDLLLKSRYLMGTPLIDAPTSWKYFNWKLEYNSALLEGDHTNLHMVKGLQHVGDTEAKWLGKIPSAALIEMRKEGAFEEIRSVLSRGVSDIAVDNPDGFFRSSDKIVDNIRDAFERHKAEIDSLTRRKIKFAGVDLGSWIVAGAIEIAAIKTSAPFFGAAAYGASQLIDAPKLRQIPERFRNLKNAHVELKKSPMGLFFKSKPRR